MNDSNVLSDLLADLAPGLKAGDLATTGTLTDAHPVQAGQIWHTEIEPTGPVAGGLEGLTVRFK